MDVSAIPRPHSAQQRPTQQYYVPRRITECGRGSVSKTETTTAATTKNKKDEKPLCQQQPTLQSASSSVPRSPKSNAPPNSNQKSNQQQKPRPLMEQILAPPPTLRNHHKEKSSSHNNNNNNNNNNTTKKEVKFQTPVVATKKSTSTASSRSSSSMSSSMSPTSTINIAYTMTTTVPNGVTKSTPRVLRPQKYAKNLFAPTVATVSAQCNCDRKNTHIMCRRCGYECVGRVLQTCGVHPLIIALNDLRECPNSVCRSTQIVELDTAELDDELIAQLAEPIHKIDLLADD